MVGLYGSSPLARGTASPAVPFGAVIRFIPAGAGNSNLAKRTTDSDTVHPRWRGEQDSIIQDGKYNVGSSPLARGTA